MTSRPHHARRDSIAGELAFQREVVRKMREIEERTDPQERVYFERGVPDGIAFYRYANLDASEVYPLCYERRYDHVFLLDLIPPELLSQDAIRDGLRFDRTRLAELALQAYATVGYEVERVPFMDFQDRVDLVMRRTSSG